MQNIEVMKTRARPLGIEIVVVILTILIHLTYLEQFFSTQALLVM